MSRARCITDCPSITLNDGAAHPQLGYGTYKVGFVPASATGSGGMAAGEGGDAKEIVQTALELGYRFLDCAEFYGNEAAVGEAIAASGVSREELFLASKVWSDTLFAGRSAIRDQVARSLADLRTDYLDLYLVHWPVPGKHVLAYKHLEELRTEGKIRSIGVSNYTIEDYDELMQHATVPPAVNQIEVNPFLYRKKTIDYFQSQGVAIQAYRSLFAGQGKKALSDPVVTAIASEHDKSPAQVLGRWCVQKGLIYLPKSEKEARMIENAAVFDFELTVQNLAALDALTSQDSIDAFAALYRKCVVRDTPLEGTGEGIKADVTSD
jgi:diketogulonate reductase-like aldo/keto reductase